MNTPGLVLKIGDKVELYKGGSASTKLTASLEANSMREVPVWLDVDKGNYRAVLKDLPKRADITSQIEEHLVVELYTK